MNNQLKSNLGIFMLILAIAAGNGLSGQVINKITSPLNQGTWRKISLNNNGVYKITGSELKSWGWDINSINPETFKVFGNHGGMLSQNSAIARSFNLDEISIQVEDGGDGVLNEGDYLLFWGESPHKWKRDVNGYVHETNIYSDASVYYVTFGGDNGKRIITENSSNNSADVSFNYYDHLVFHETEEHKIHHSGREFHGERYLETESKTFDITVPNPEPGYPASLKIAFAGSGESSSVSYVLNGFNLGTVNGLLGSDESASNRYTESEKVYSVNTINTNNQLRINYTKGGNNSIGYLNYFELKAKSKLILSNQLVIQNEGVIGKNTSEFKMQNSNKNFTLWNITNPWSIAKLNTSSIGSETTFKAENNGENYRMVSFDGSSFLSVKDEGAQANQNLVGISVPDMVIIAHPNFWEAANTLAAHRRSHDGLSVEVIAPTTIYNEFSSGIQDITAFRDFMRYLYFQNGSKLKYLLLFGDASYDYKDRVANNTNFVPTYESPESISDIGSYCSDDYYGFLDSNEGLWLTKHSLEIGVGRLPVGSPEEAKAVVEKIIRYDSPKSFGKWRTGVSFLADDMDLAWDVDHFNYSESISTIVKNNHSVYNNSKIYMDAFKEVLLGGAGSYPDASKEVDESMNKGTLIFNYIGHGGVGGMAKERVVTVEQINAWKNLYKMPVFITATCELTSYDNPLLKSAGEHMLCNPVGGPVALLTTTRIVYSAPNFVLNQKVWTDNILADNASDRIGDVYLRTKNTSNAGNDRRFTLIGDPSMRLAKPRHKIFVDKINGIATSSSDTFKALSKVEVEGHLEKRDGSQWSDFNGVVDVTIYDKALDEKTIGNGVNGVSHPYKHLRSIIYSGKVDAVDGRYKFSFIVPKDINYNIDYGKISLYAHNNIEDAAGSKTDIFIGGADENPEADDLGPEIKLYIDDRSFINGGTTDESPLLIADLYDDHGINVSSSGIGRNLMLTLDKGTDIEQRIVVNDFYNSDAGTYQKGVLEYLMADIAEGSHTLHLKVWDTYNNSSEASIKFVVGQKTDQFAIYTIRSVPNPFSQSPRIIIDHNRPDVDIEIESQLMGLTGKQIFNTKQTITNAQQHIEFKLNGGNSWTNQINPGVYLLRCTLTTSDGESKTFKEKIVYAP